MMGMILFEKNQAFGTSYKIQIQTGAMKVTGATAIEWRVADEKAAQSLKKFFIDRHIDITTKYVGKDR